MYIGTPRHVPFDGAQGKQAAPGRRTPNYGNGLDDFGRFYIRAIRVIRGKDQ